MSPVEPPRAQDSIPGTAVMMRIRGLLAQQLHQVPADDPERSRLVAILAITASPDQGQS